MTKGVEFAQQIAEGDFTQTLEIRQHDEVGTLGTALNEMASRLREVVTTVQESASQVAHSSQEILTSAGRLAEDAQSQASTLEETIQWGRSSRLRKHRVTPGSKPDESAWSVCCWARLGQPFASEFISPRETNCFALWLTPVSGSICSTLC